MATILYNKKPIKIGNSLGFRISKSEFNLNPDCNYKLGIVQIDVITNEVPDTIPNIEQEQRRNEDV